MGPEIRKNEVRRTLTASPGGVPVQLTGGVMNLPVGAWRGSPEQVARREAAYTITTWPQCYTHWQRKALSATHQVGTAVR